MKFSKGFFHFNKEILSGELGAFLGAQVVGLIVKHLDLTKSQLSFLVVLGAVLGSAMFYLPMRIWHQKQRDDFSVGTFSKDVVLYSMAAIILTISVYYPTLFFLERFLLKFIKEVNLSILVAQSIAFLLFLFFINVYRLILKVYFHKEL